MLPEYLPLLDGWDWIFKCETKPEIISAGAPKKVLTIKKPGWLCAASFAFNNPDTKLSVTYDVVTQEVSCRTLKDSGITMPHPGGIWVSRYNDASLLYAFNVTPIPPWPFRKKAEVNIKAPEGAAIILLSYMYLLIQIVDAEKFLDSLHKVLGGKS